MVTSIKDLMTQAREVLSGRWGLAVGTFFVYILIVAALNHYPLLNWRGAGFHITISSSLVWLLIGGALTLGVATFSLAIARKEKADLKMIFSCFKYYGKTFGLYLLMMLFCFLVDATADSSRYYYSNFHQ